MTSALILTASSHTIACAHCNAPWPREAAQCLPPAGGDGIAPGAEGAADAGRRAGARWEVSQRVARAAVDLRATMGGVAAGLWARGAG